jgi:hypothetical protein
MIEQILKVRAFGIRLLQNTLEKHAVNTLA